MKKFLLYIAGFATLMLVIMFTLDVCYTHVYAHYAVRTKFQMFKRFTGHEVGFVFIGSSRVENGIVPSIIKEKTGKEAVNLGVQAAKLNDIYTVLQLLKEYNLKYEKVFIQVDYNFDATGRSISLPHEMAPFIKDNAVTKAYYKSYSDFLLMYYLPFYRYSAFDHKIGIREMLTTLLRKDAKLIATNGYVPLKQGDLGTMFPLPSRISKRNLEYERIRAYCKKHQINAIFYCAPFWKETKNLNYIKALKVKIPDLHDYSQAIDDPEMFNNNLHLNDLGARLFTNKLTDELLMEINSHNDIAY